LTLNARVPFSSMLLLSLKRNFISVFLPAGGIASYAFFNEEVEKHGISKTKTYLASVVYGISGFASLILIAIPALLLLFLSHNLSKLDIIAFVFLFILVIFLVYAFRSFVGGGRIFRLASRFFPSLVVVFDELKEEKYSVKYFIRAIFYSFLIELCGIAHLYLVLQALGLKVNLEIALIGYVVATLMYAISPFMRGLGAVELTLSIVLIQFGIPHISSISVSLLYRFFEFWLPLLAGACSFFYKKDNLLLRIFPAFLTLVLGLINILSVLTPALKERIVFVRDFLPEKAIYLSNFATTVIGIIMIVLSAYLIRGLRTAWMIALIITGLSVVLNLAKAIDYEEALFAASVFALLLYTRKNYTLKNDRRLFQTVKTYFLGAFIFIFVYGIVGFYYLDPKHFGIDFTLGASIKYLFTALFLFNNQVLQPHTKFAVWFMDTLNFLGVAYIAALVYVAFKPGRYKHTRREEELSCAKEYVEQYGRSALDYFKTYFDKLIYFGNDGKSFVSFKVASDYAIVLETPVCEKDEDIPLIVTAFDAYCLRNGLKTLYYRVDEKHLRYFERLNKKSIFIGQEGLVDLETFTLEGGEKKPTRNALHKVQACGYTCKIYEPPIKEGLIQKLKAVSDEWLIAFDKSEIAFTQGVWNAKAIKNQVLFVVENDEEKVAAFANIIPDYASDEGTYDLIRKTLDAPGGVLDTIMVNMIEYFKKNKKKYLNLGMTPLSGITAGKNFKERTIRFAYENLKQFDHFKGLRFFKEKYACMWNNKYLIFSNNLDLLQAPGAIEKVSKDIST
jgi:phosphatidylglycerol lysyltransferase